ncbi:MAG TPA: protease inhibitor I42 family protein [Actinomycetota bacterium]
MHTLTPRSLLVLLGLVLAAAACGGAADAGSSVNLTVEDDGRAVEMEPGDRLVVALESNASTGFRWILVTEPDPAVLSLDASEYVEPETDLVGAPGQEVWTFLAEGDGETSLELRYERSSGEIAGKPFEVTVLVG